MPGVGTYPVVSAPARVLRPDAALARLSDQAGLTAGRRFFTPQYRRWDRIRYLMRTFFPRDHKSFDNYDWWEAMDYFFSKAQEAGWFDIDYDTLENLWQWANSDSGPDDEEEENDPNWEPDGLYLMGLGLDIIPIACKGFNDEGYGGRQDIGTFPPLALLDGLLGDGKWRWSESLADFDVFQGLPKDSDLQKELSRRCWQVVNGLDVSTLPPPLHLIPDAARYATGSTGNFVLDTPGGYEGWQWASREWPRWDSDVEKMKIAWAEAEVYMARIRPLIEWASSENELEAILDIFAAQLRALPEYPPEEIIAQLENE